jgi:DNA-binding CsgD family transcriptional regulator
MDASAYISRRETDVVSLLALGLKCAAIGEKLFISLNTVRTHIKNIKAKTHCRTIAQIVAYAIHNGLLK